MRIKRDKDVDDLLNDIIDVNDPGYIKAAAINQKEQQKAEMHDHNQL